MPVGIGAAKRRLLRRMDPDWATISDPDSPGRYLGFGPVPEAKAVKNRLHLDLLPEQGCTRIQQRQRLEALGANYIRTVYHDGQLAHDVMGDPEGNEFCLLEPYPEYYAASPVGISDVDMTGNERIVSVSEVIAAPADRIFDFIADPAAQPSWDGNDNLAEAEAGQRVPAIGEVFTMTLTKGVVRENHIVEFDEGRLIAWLPAEQGQQPPGHLWRWELDPLDAGHTRVKHTYDWTNLTDPQRIARARVTTADKLAASVQRLKQVAEGS